MFVFPVRPQYLSASSVSVMICPYLSWTSPSGLTLFPVYVLVMLYGPFTVSTVCNFLCFYGQSQWRVSVPCFLRIYLPSHIPHAVTAMMVSLVLREHLFTHSCVCFLVCFMAHVLHHISTWKVPLIFVVSMHLDNFDASAYWDLLCT